MRMKYDVAAFYRFVSILDVPAAQSWTKELCQKNDICGTILLAPEGINATIAGFPEQLKETIEQLDQRFGIRQGELKFSHASEKPFLRMKVKLKKEIITMRQPQADPTKQVGTYVTPDEWNNIITQDDVVVLDTRNDYETKIGIFKNAIDPKIKIFTEFVDYVRENLDPKKHKKIAMFCTGGIRCEKASSFMLAEGFEEVYHLKGGILQYLEDVPAEESLWDGECYVFDRRTSIGHGLVEGPHTICYGCGEPITAEDCKSPAYEEGVSCAQCCDTQTEERKRKLRARHADVLAKRIVVKNVKSVQTDNQQIS